MLGCPTSTPAITMTRESVGDCSLVCPPNSVASPGIRVNCSAVCGWGGVGSLIGHRLVRRLKNVRLARIELALNTTDDPVTGEGRHRPFDRRDVKHVRVATARLSVLAPVTDRPTRGQSPVNDRR